MIIKKKYRDYCNIDKMTGFFIAISPILDPYKFIEVYENFTLSINDICMIIISILCLKKYGNRKYKTNYLYILLIGFLLFTLVANISNNTNLGNSMKNLCVWFVYSVALMYIWKCPCRDQFFKYVKIIGIIASIVVLIQLIGGYLKLPIWNGRIPYIELTKYNGWAGYIDKNTGDIRPNGIFQEPSYVGIYLSISYIRVWQERKIKLIILYTLVMFSTTSMLAILNWFLITFYNFIRKRNKMKIILMGIFCFGIFLVAINNFDNSNIYILSRLKNFNSDLTGARMSSTKYRLLGHINVFSRYSVIQKLFGVGIGQYSSYFNVSSYSNVWVTTILNSGILGLCNLGIILIIIFKKMIRENRIFFLILLIVFSCDYQWFSWYFFYLISACILTNKKIKL